MADKQLSLRLTRLFKAPRSLLFEMWSNPEHMRNWGCPVGFTVVYSNIDFRVGGAWSSCMRSPQSIDHRLGGKYLEIVQDERIVYSSAWLDDNDNPVQSSVITLSFKSIGDDTELILEQAPFETVSSRDSHQHGWIESLTNLENYLDGLR